jgi:hypothetical protein
VDRLCQLGTDCVVGLLYDWLEGHDTVCDDTIGRADGTNDRITAMTASMTTMTSDRTKQHQNKTKQNKTKQKKTRQLKHVKFYRDVLSIFLQR